MMNLSCPFKTTPQTRTQLGLRVIRSRPCRILNSSEAFHNSFQGVQKLNYSIGRRRSSRTIKVQALLNAAEYRKEKALKKEKEDDEDEGLCPVDCVKEFRTQSELEEVLVMAKETDALVVIDFYKTACGSCRYIEQGFIKLCKGAGDNEASVIFLKHNVVDEYDEQSEVAERLKIKVVPTFHFYRDANLVEAFPTRDKAKLVDAIQRNISKSV